MSKLNKILALMFVSAISLSAEQVATTQKLQTADAVAAPDAKPKQSGLVTTAGPVTLKLNGSTFITLAQPRQSDTTNGKTGAPHLNVYSARLRFTASGEYSEGYQFKLISALNVLPGGSSGEYIDQAYIEAATPYGVFQVGSVGGPIGSIVKDGWDLIGGTAGTNGTFGQVINYAEGVIAGVDPYGISGNANKIVYYTPEFGSKDTSWFIAGVSYTPNTTIRGKDSMSNNKSSSNLFSNESAIYPDKAGAAYGLNNVILAVQAGTNLGAHKFTFSVANVFEKSKRGGDNWPSKDYDSSLEFYKFKNVKNANSWEYAITYNYKDLTLAAGFIQNNKSRLPYTVGYSAGNAGHAWNVGLLYQINKKLAISFLYVETKRKLPSLPSNTAGVTNCVVLDKARSKSISASLDYNVASGLDVFTEGTIFKMKTDKNFAKFMGTTNSYTSKNTIPTSKNVGYMIAVGVKASF